VNGGLPRSAPLAFLQIMLALFPIAAPNFIIKNGASFNILLSDVNTTGFLFGFMKRTSIEYWYCYSFVLVFYRVQEALTNDLRPVEVVWKKINEVCSPV